MNNILAIKNSKNIEYLKFCVECGVRFTTTRDDKLACSDRCRQRVTRRKKAFKPFLVRVQTSISNTDLKKFNFDKGSVTILDRVTIIEK